MRRCGSCGASVSDDARFCPSCGAPQMQAAGEERKLATVLFADLVGSTALAHDEDPERVRARLARFYEAMAAEIERTGGTVEKFAGDGVMAVFGAPAALEDHAERALHAGLAMQRRLGELLEGQLAMRIGVNTGEVVVGPPEGGSFVTGDAVNVGARLEQGAASGEVLAGERTVAAARGAFEFGEARVLEAKGKPGGVVAHPVVRALTLARPRGLAGFRQVFVGREREVDLLLATVRRAFGQREPHLVTIVGEPGVGKTTLVQELWERLSVEDPVPVRRTGRCLPYGDGITYWPLGEVLKEHFGLLEGASRRRRRRATRGTGDPGPRVGRARCGRAPSPRRARAAACRGGRLPGGGRARAACRRAVRGHPLGGGRLPRSARADRARGTSSRRGARDGASGAPRPPSDVGRRPAEHDDDLARSARGGGRIASRRGPARPRASGRVAEASRRALRGEPVLRRGARRRARGRRRDRAGRRRLGGRRGPGGLLRAGQRAGGHRRPARPAPGAREVRAPGRGRRRPGVLAGRGDGARRRRARLRPARGAGLRAPPEQVVARGRARVRDQARPDARGRLREHPEGTAREAPRGARRLAHRARSRRGAGRIRRVPLRGGSAAGGRRPRVGRRSGASTNGGAARRSRGFVVPAGSRAAATRWRRRSISSCAPSSSATTTTSGRSSGGRSVWRGRSATTATACGSPCSSRSRGRSTARSAPTRTRPSPSRPHCGRRCGRPG